MTPPSTTSAASSAPLAGIRVLDLSRVLAGPWATQVLADLGAEVLKIEKPGAGDDTRHWGPPWVDAAHQTAAYYLCANRNKRSVTLDIARPAGQAIARQLIARCDVLVENFKVGGLARYGLDYASVRALNPRLIYCSITGFGQNGPYAERAGYDFLVQGLGGLMSVTGRADDEPGGGPMKVGVALVDILTGLYAANAIQAALTARTHTGAGQHIDMALLDVQVACLANQAMNYLASGTAPGRRGNAHPNIVPYQDFPTADGHMILAIGNDGQFQRFCAAAGQLGLATDTRFASNGARVQNRAVLIPLLNAITARRSTDDWIAKLEDCAVPCGPINDLARVFADPQVRARGLQQSLPGADGRPVPTIANPMRLSATPVEYRNAPPELGADTHAVLHDLLGLTEDELQDLKTAGAI